MQQRSCSGCLVCCEYLALDHREIQKPAGVLCRNCSTQGCSIYDQRPTPCRDFWCAWRVLPNVPENLRPDKSGLLVLLDAQQGAIGEARVAALTMMPIHNRQTVLTRPEVVEFMRAEVLAGMRVYLSIPGGPGFLPLRTDISGAAMRVAARQGHAAFARVLGQALAFLENAPQRTYHFDHRGCGDAH